MATELLKEKGRQTRRVLCPTRCVAAARTCRLWLMQLLTPAVVTLIHSYNTSNSLSEVWQCYRVLKTKCNCLKLMNE